MNLVAGDIHMMTSRHSPGSLCWLELCLQENRIDTRGIEALFDCCHRLRHLNLGGEHHHVFTPHGNAVVIQVMKKLRRKIVKNIQSIIE